MLAKFARAHSLGEGNCCAPRNFDPQALPHEARVLAVMGRHRFQRGLRARASAHVGALVSGVVSAADVRSTQRTAPLARALLRDDRVLASYWWRGTPNFGDALSPAILAHVTGLEPRHVSPHSRGKVVALGSVLATVRAGDTVWGTGCIREGMLDLTEARILAVRGPRTKAQIRGDVPDVFGDPAIVLPRMYKPTSLSRVEIGIIPHVVDQNVMATNDSHVAMIDLATTDWMAVVDEICRCDIVISSSLHGLIVAEAYGIPAVWVEASKGVIGDGFKFFDYYESTDRGTLGPLPWGNDLSRLVAAAVPPPPLDADPLLAAWSLT